MSDFFEARRIREGRETWKRHAIMFRQRAAVFTPTSEELLKRSAGVMKTHTFKTLTAFNQFIEAGMKAQAEGKKWEKSFTPPGFFASVGLDLYESLVEVVQRSLYDYSIPEADRLAYIAGMKHNLAEMEKNDKYVTALDRAAVWGDDPALWTSYIPSKKTAGMLVGAASAYGGARAMGYDPLRVPRLALGGLRGAANVVSRGVKRYFSEGDGAADVVEDPYGVEDYPEGAYYFREPAPPKPAPESTRGSIVGSILDMFDDDELMYDVDEPDPEDFFDDPE